MSVKQNISFVMRQFVMIIVLLCIAPYTFGQFAGVWPLDGSANSMAGDINGFLKPGDWTNGHYSYDESKASFSNLSKVGSKCLSLTGGYVDLGNPGTLPSGTSPRSISVWARSKNVYGTRTIVAYGSPSTNASMFIGQNGSSLVAGAFNNSFSISNFWATDIWHHIALTYDGTTAKLFADGAEVASATKSWNLALANFYFGRNVSNDESPWEGLIDQVKIYGQAITPEQVVSDVKAGTTKIARWHFDNNTMEYMHYSSNSIPLNAPTYSNDNPVGMAALVLNGTNQYINIGSSPPYTLPSGLSERSITLWAKTNTLTGKHTVVEFGTPSGTESMFIGQSGSSLIAGSYGDYTDLTVPNFWTTDTWYHLALTYNGQIAKLYVNGILVASATKTWSLTPGAAFIGRSTNSTADYWNGAIDELTIYSSAVIIQEIQEGVSIPSAKPTGLIATAISTSEINLNWVDNSNNETEFELYQSLTPGTGYHRIGSVSANSTTFSHTALTEGVTYLYKIRALNTVGNSSFSNEASALTFANPPSNLTLLATSSSSTQLNWVDNSEAETGYKIERSTSATGPYSLLTTTLRNTITYDDTGLAAATPYYYRVSAVFPGGVTVPVEGNITTITVAQESAVVGVLNNLAFQYKYDLRKRMTAKKVPGADWVYMVYDDRDRLVLTQDGNQRTLNQWSFTKYDQLNRPILTGIKDTTAVLTQAQMQLVVDNFYATKTWTKLSETYVGNATGNIHGYTNKSYPITTNGATIDASKYLTVSYYDDYSFKSMTEWATNYSYTNDSLSATVINGTYTQPTTESLRVVGLPTGSKTKVLDGGNTYIKAITYYDDKYRPIQVISDTYKGGTIAGRDRTSTLYDFPGKALKTKTTHLIGTSNERIITRRLEYDHARRLLKTYHLIGTNASNEKLLSQNSYNEIGQLVDKQLHSTDNGTTFKQSVDYRYNIRGWMTKINESDVSSVAANETLPDYFGMELAYNTTLTDVAATGQFNGNISAAKWSLGANGGANKQGYGYAYDPMNRLTNSYHNKRYALIGWTADNANQEGDFDYDLNGNIKALTRKGPLSETLDNLSYTYTGNQLNYVNDAGDAAKGFVNGNTGTDDYLYDANGNMTLDKNKGITAIAYNHLNLPQQVNKGVTDYIKYTYDATGRKLSQQVFGTTPKTTDYAGEFIYEGTALQFINTEEGRILPDGANWEYQYHLKDHLGNVRVTFTTKTPTTTVSTADFEGATNTDFQNYNRTGFDLVDHTDAGTTKTYVQWLHDAGRVGLAKSMSVMPGDQVTIAAYCKYKNLDNNMVNAEPLITALASAFGVGPSSTGNELKVYNSLNFYSGTVVGGDHDPWYPDDEGAPKVFVTILFFDKDYSFVDAAWDQVSTTGAQTSESVKQPPHDLLSITAAAKEAGFAYVFVSNEHPKAVNVYFDDVSVSHTPSPIVSSSDYYPFGLTFNSYQRENAVVQNFKYNGVENENELDLNINTTFFRMHDPAIGRWWQIDPKPREDMSLYAAVGDNPILYSDPMGDTTRVYSRTGKLLNTINDTQENQVHFMSKRGYAKMNQSRGEKESDNDFASRVRENSDAFIGSNTISDMAGIVKESGNLKKEIAFVGSISGTREIRLTKLPVDENNSFSGVQLSSQLDKNYSQNEQSKFFLVGHVHHKAVPYLNSPTLPESVRARNLGTPTIGWNDNVPYDYHSSLRGVKGVPRQTAGMVATPYGFSLYETVPKGGSPSGFSLISFKYFKRGNVK